MAKPNKLMVSIVSMTGNGRRTVTGLVSRQYISDVLNDVARGNHAFSVKMEMDDGSTEIHTFNTRLFIDIVVYDKEDDDAESLHTGS